MIKQDKTIVFCGPSISIDRAKEILPSAYFPGPIQRGDLEKYDAENFCIIDGFFLQNLAVAPKEIIEKLRQKRRVFGAASMGALRAAECYLFGMKGYGTIFKMFQSGEIMNDDEVAVLVRPITFLQLSDALIDIRMFLKKAIEHHWVQANEGQMIIDRLQKTHFPERSFKHCLLELQNEGFLENETLEELLKKFSEEPQQKFLDAVECLNAVKIFLKNGSYGDTIN